MLLNYILTYYIFNFPLLLDSLKLFFQISSKKSCERQFLKWNGHLWQVFWQFFVHLLNSTIVQFNIRHGHKGLYKMYKMFWRKCQKIQIESNMFQKKGQFEGKKFIGWHFDIFMCSHYKVCTFSSIDFQKLVSYSAKPFRMAALTTWKQSALLHKG